MKTFRVFHIITHFDLGGAERVAANIAHSANDGFEYHLIEVVKGEGRFRQAFIRELEEAHIHYHCSPVQNNKLGIISFPFRFLSMALRLRPQVIHTHTEVPDLSVYLWSKLFGWTLPSVRYVRTIHNTVLWSQWDRIGRIVEKFYQKTQGNVAISSSVLESYQCAYNIIPPHFIFNGVATVVQRPFGNLVAGRINILFAGRLEPQKGVDQLIEVVKALKNDQRFHFHIVGNGSMQEKVRSAVGAQGNVSLYDRVFGLNHYLGSFDCLFMPSNHEGLGLMSIEASLAHTLTVINNCPGLRETLPEDWPFKVENNRVEDFVQIIRSLDNHLTDNEWPDVAYEFAQEHFSIEKMQREYEHLYISLTKE